MSLFTKEQQEKIFGTIQVKKVAKKSNYISFAFGTVVLNQDNTAGITWNRSSDSPDLILPGNSWLHSVIITAFVNHQDIGGVGATNILEVETLQGFPVQFTMAGGGQNLLKVIRGEGQGGVVNPNFQPMVQFLQGNTMLLPIGTHMQFEKYQFPIGSDLSSINILTPGPWSLVGQQNSSLGVIGMGAQVTIAYESDE